jgi:cytochrome c-type biogenesis protein
MVSYISAHGNANGEKHRHSAKLLAVSFFIGVTTGLLVLGTAAAYFGRLLVRWSVGFAIATAVISILAGLVALFGPFVRRRVPNPEIKKRGGIGGAFMYGLLFTIATITTSAGPLMLLLTIAAAVGKPVYGAGLSLAYGIGRGLPFLLVGLFAGRVAGWLARLERGRRVAEVISGIALIAVGAYFLRLATQIA